MIEILLIEDDPGDVLITQEAFADADNINSNLHVVSDGLGAMDFLHKRGRYRSAVTPDLILLDLNLPRMDGREVLIAVKTDPVLRQIPVIVLTTSDAEEDLVRSYQQHANAYVHKPVDTEDFIEVIRGIDEFFVSIARLPYR
jgi:CheY-like chemotaxis protein